MTSPVSVLYMAPPSDCNLDLERGPDESVDDDDVNSLKSNVIKKIVRGKRTPTGGSSTSRLSKRSFIATPLRKFRTLTDGSQFTNEPERKRPSHGRDLIEFLRGGPLSTDSFLDASDWYTVFLDSKCQAHWHAIQPIVEGVKQGGLGPDAGDIAKIDKVFAYIAKKLSERKDYALVNLEDDLINDGLIIDDPSDERAAIHQLMFTFLGWLTMLYEPRLDCKPKKLQVAKLTLRTDGQKVNLVSRAFDTFGQDFEYVDQSLYLLLGLFGKLIPNLPLLRSSEIAPPSEWIVVPYVCYQTLAAVCRVEIEWVDALAMHLEFDSNRRVLKIFRYPSFCRLMYKHKQRGLLSQLFDDKEYDLRGEPGKNCSANDYFREMLLTYRLIFGQDAKSSRLFAKELAALSAPAKTPPRSKPMRPPHVFALPETDPLLETLCARRASTPGAADIYSDINAAPAQSYYTPQSFPFFAQKLLTLQAYVKEQHPHDWKALWHDHRNKSNWWQFWAVLFIGGGTLVLGTLSLVFQIWQAVLTQQQLMQGANTAPSSGSPRADI